MNREPKCDLIIVFTRYPVPGKTKTRLTPAFGPARAAELQRVLTEKTVGRARKTALRATADIEICFEGATKGRMLRWLGPGLRYSRQDPGNLGARMEGAFLKAFQKGYRRVVLIGTDIPGLKGIHLREAFGALDTHDLVLGPSTDGGYWLVGQKKPAPLFKNIPWGTGAVLEKTLALVAKNGLRAFQIKALTDVDTYEDLEECMPGWVDPGPYISVIIPSFNEEKKIAAAIRSALDAEAEVIVADGGSRDDTVSRAREAGARVIRCPRGRGVQQNFGAATAKGDNLLFLHADTLLPEHYVSHVFDTLMDPGIVLGAFRFRVALNRPCIRIIETFANARSRYFKMPYGDQGLFMRRALFHSLGGFPDTPIGEDLFLVRRFAKMGRIGLAPVHTLTSGRRWKAVGVLRTTLINQIILAGFLFRIPLPTLASLYRRQGKQIIRVQRPRP